MSKQKKQPKVPDLPRKQVRESQETISPLTPLWSFVHIDIGGEWCWTKLEPATEGDVLTKLGQFEGMTWTELRQHNCHEVEVESLIKEAQKRLEEIGQDDADTLYSLRISGKARIWSIKDGNILRLLWADPKHEICPSLLKHT